jgi:CheY-like chemotaxis protein
VSVASRLVRVLLVDDDERDIDLFSEALAARDINVELHVARDGLECLAFLRREGSHAGAARPDIVLLDLNMPRMGGS